MFYKSDCRNFPRSPTVRDDGEIVTGVVQVGAYYEATGQTFPIAYLVRDTGPYLTDGRERTEFAHYHPLAH
jgi:hypothetical protein